MRNAFRGLPCVYCGAPATSDDHVIAAKFFLEPQRRDLPEVPACQRCNNEKSHLEDYLMVVLGFGAKHPDAKVNLDTLVRRRLENNLRLKRELEAGFDGVKIPFDHPEKIETLFAMIAQGLAWYHWKVLLKPGFSAIASLFHDSGAPFFTHMLAGWGTPIRVSDDLGNGTFVYEGAQATDVPEATVWRFQMYGGITFGGDPKRPGPASLAVAVTGRDSAIRNLRFKGAVAHRDSKKIGRNESCPCGSGKKYKRCHGGIQRDSVSVAATNVAPSVYQPLAAHGYGPHQFGNELRGR